MSAEQLAGNTLIRYSRVEIRCDDRDFKAKPRPGCFHSRHHWCAQDLVSNRPWKCVEARGAASGACQQCDTSEMIYTATISSTSLRLRESRIVADLLLQAVSDDDWKEAVIDQNILQMGSPVTTTRSSNILRARLDPLGEGLWKMVRDGGHTLATQAAFAGTVKHSRLLGDFMDITMREQRALFATKLEKRVWNEYIAG